MCRSWENQGELMKKGYEGVARRTRDITIDATRKKTVAIKLASSPNELQLSDVDLDETKKNLYNLSQILLNSNASPIRSHNVRGYTCAFCSEQFLEPYELKKHFLEEHRDDQLIRRISVMSGSTSWLAGCVFVTSVVKLDITLLNCALCDTDFDLLQDLMLHLTEVHNKTLYMNIQNQLLPFKFETPDLRCAICSAEYVSFKMLVRHMNVHFSNYVCDICNAGFAVERLLKRHVTKHDDEKGQCSECEKVFINRHRLHAHILRMHKDFKGTKCQYCDERFPQYDKKRIHMIKEHGVTPVVFKCGACDRTYGSQSALTKHTRKDHLMERKHICPLCGKKFFFAYHLKVHSSIHTGIKMFKCDLCSREFRTKSILKQHIKTHTNDRKRYACVHCGLSFVQNSSLNRHLRHLHSMHDETL